MAKREQSATTRMEGARRVKHDAVTRELLWAAIGARVWPAYLAKPRIEQANFPFILCIDSPAGPIVYRVSAEELPLFDRLERRESGPDYESGDKMAALLLLASDGW